MSSTAYQRSMVDMTKAGLNPGLMYGSGGAESSPSGASMTPPNAIGDAGQSALQGLSASKALQVSDSQIAQNLAGAALTTAKIPSEKFEGKLASGADALIGKVSNILQGYFPDKVAQPGAVNKPGPDISPGSLDNLGGSGGSKAGNGSNGVVAPGIPSGTTFGN